MRVVLFGATGMIGSGVLTECLESEVVSEAVSVTRRTSGVSHRKLREVVHGDFGNFAPLRASFTNADACFFCLGISSIGLSEAEYAAVTVDVVLAAAREMVAVSPQMTFCFVSGTGADSSERGPVMWARVKGRAENALLGIPFRRAFVLRPGVVQPLKGARSRTKLYRVLYTVLAPLTAVLRLLFPGYVTTTVNIGRAMLVLATQGSDLRVLGNGDINRTAARLG
jgi:uncharacterized protein YbjT (DUF2867 family)